MSLWPCFIFLFFLLPRPLYSNKKVLRKRKRHTAHTAQLSWFCMVEGELPQSWSGGQYSSLAEGGGYSSPGRGGGTPSPGPGCTAREMGPETAVGTWTRGWGTQYPSPTCRDMGPETGVPLSLPPVDGQTNWKHSLPILRKRTVMINLKSCYGQKLKTHICSRFLHFCTSRRLHRVRMNKGCKSHISCQCEKPGTHTRNPQQSERKSSSHRINHGTISDFTNGNIVLL